MEKMNIKLGQVSKKTDGRWLNLFEIDFTNLKGNPGQWAFASRKANPTPGTAPLISDAVVIVPYLKVGRTWRLVLINEFRIPLGDYELAFPAGLPDAGESNATAAIRELKEETGLQVSRVVKTTAPLVSSAGLSDECVSMVFVECTGAPHVMNAEASEDIQVMVLDWAGVNAICEACLEDSPNKPKISAKTWPILFMHQAMGVIKPPVVAKKDKKNAKPTT